MIIRKLIADNLLKFERLELTGLPEKGIIAISGANESGKSAILEAICLALFGRSFALEAGETAKVVRWGAATAGVEMEFTGRDGSDYIIIRHFDSEGRQRARFGKKRSRFPLRGLEAVNPAVREAVGFDYPRFVETLYLPQRRNERPDSAPSLPGMIPTIRALAGVEDLDGVRRAYQLEIQDSQRAITRMAEQHAGVEEKIRALNLDLSLLGRLQNQLQEAETTAERAQQTISQWQAFAQSINDAKNRVEQAVKAFPDQNLDRTQQEWHSLLDGLDQALLHHRKSCLENHLVEVEKDPGSGLERWSKDWRNRLSDLAAILEDVTLQRQGISLWLGERKEETDSKVQGYAQERQRILSLVSSFQRWRRWHGLGTTLSLSAASLAWGVWAGVTRFPEKLAPYLPKLKAALPFWDTSKAEQPLVVAVALSVVAALWLGRYLHQRHQVAGSSSELAKLEARAQDERKMGQKIDASLEKPLPERLEMLGSLDKASWIAKINQWRNGSGAALVYADTWQESRQKLLGFLQRYMEDLEGLNQDISQQVQESALRLKQCRNDTLSLRSQITAEEHRQQEGHRLLGQLNGLNDMMVNEERSIRVRQAGVLLLDGAAKELLIAFNLELRRHLSRIVPLFTEGRFQHLNMDDAMQVTLYSSEKEGFVELSEVSTGVQQQLLLAVRFALAQALVSRSVRTPQCVILDEPFAFFDRNRLAKSMVAMGQMSNEMVQFWITSQDFEAGLPVDVPLHCQQGIGRLILAKK
ncbi:MAG: AAA family ATPase [Magnetococcales bacterium]|nr:AAA family ATPase [Magnetococcales bacterium]NGZ25521.1 AAA family ATPase [Magnetococcales bacterium]